MCAIDAGSATSGKMGTDSVQVSQKFREAGLICHEMGRKLLQAGNRFQESGNIEDAVRVLRQMESKHLQAAFMMNEIRGELLDPTMKGLTRVSSLLCCVHCYLKSCLNGKSCEYISRDSYLQPCLWMGEVVRDYQGDLSAILRA